MTSYAEASAAASGNETQSYGLCAAFGCCLPGTLTMNTQGTKDWHCRLHFGAPRSEFDDISARTKNRKALFTVAYWLVNRPKGDSVSRKVLDRIEALGRADILASAVKAEKLTAYHLGAHMLRVLGDECRHPRRIWAPPSPPARPGWTKTKPRKPKHEFTKHHQPGRRRGAGSAGRHAVGQLRARG